ncbi:DUF2147 domain-containing protein [Sphingomonas sp. Leaf339]|uniref:DUF2147 domain-containing protein n=1 Tax=Sphingomonas sp. Leaf339 TaxID=1736343 RepID=UPI0009EB3CFE|nr:DUF2147 domain-containing protein [Sphingomonas sp. Leaf339]
MRCLIGLAVAAAINAVPAAAQRPGDAIAGLWMNPYNSVAVRAGDCGPKLCGWVAWANAEAKSDAREEGVDPLIGVALLQDYQPSNAKNWSGTIFVPDLGRHFSSTITLLDRDRLKVKGCLIGGFICKSQVWRRIEHLPDA